MTVWTPGESPVIVDVILPGLLVLANAIKAFDWKSQDHNGG